MHDSVLGTMYVSVYYVLVYYVVVRVLSRTGTVWA